MAINTSQMVSFPLTALRTTLHPYTIIIQLSVALALFDWAYVINFHGGGHSRYLSHPGVSGPYTGPSTHECPLTADEPQPLLSLLEPLKNKEHLSD